MRSRWPAILLALVTLLGSLSGTASVSASTAAARSGCCGASCACDDRCPCVSRGDAAPDDSGRTAPPPAPREMRLLSVFAGSPIALDALLPQPVLHGRAACAEADVPAGLDGGRRILERVSRWTT